ncbi:MAG: hypothetical protein HFI47_12235 [Lachnospiraceae bacterium]|jgi:hypothetical protein|nr:hypothetical protein [Lachnospiraceae bacterium]
MDKKGKAHETCSFIPLRYYSKPHSSQPLLLPGIAVIISLANLRSAVLACSAAGKEYSRIPRHNPPKHIQIIQLHSQFVFLMLLSTQSFPQPFQPSLKSFLNSSLCFCAGSFHTLLTNFQSALVPKTQGNNVNAISKWNYLY